MQTFRQFVNEVRIDGAQIDATKFEADLVAALNAQSRASYQNPTAQKIAIAAAKHLRADGVRGAARRNSGKGGAQNLTPIYREHGVTSGEAKTDIIVGTKRYSMKYGRAAQIAAAQAPEAKAVFAAAFQNHPDYTNLIERQLLPIIGGVIDKKTFYTIRKKFNRKDLAEFGNQLSRFLRLHSSADAMTDAELKMFRGFLESVGVAVPAKTVLMDFLDTPGTKQALFYEFTSGEKRFIDATNSPTHMLAWFENGTIKQSTVRSFVRSHLNQFDYSFRDRGSSRGGAFRLSISESVSRATAPLACTMTTEALDAWVDARVREIRQDLLQEGLIDTMTGALNTVWSWFIAAMKKVLQAFVQLAQRGLSAVMSVFGVEPTGLSWTWPAETSPSADPDGEWA